MGNLLAHGLAWMARDLDHQLVWVEEVPQSLIEVVIADAVFCVFDQRSAVGMTHMVGNMTIYGYVDCTRDVNGQDSTTCLLGATDSIPCSCLGKWAGWIATPTCNIQFNMDPVHDDWINPLEIDTNMATATVLVTEPSALVDDGGLESSAGDGGDGNKEREVSYWLLRWLWHLFW
ncbi:unnamed protein product [Camellia sinensis]